MNRKVTRNSCLFAALFCRSWRQSCSYDRHRSDGKGLCAWRKIETRTCCGSFNPTIASVRHRSKEKRSEQLSVDCDRGRFFEGGEGGHKIILVWKTVHASVYTFFQGVKVDTSTKVRSRCGAGRWKRRWGKEKAKAVGKNTLKQECVGCRSNEKKSDKIRAEVRVVDRWETTNLKVFEHQLLDSSFRLYHT